MRWVSVAPRCGRLHRVVEEAGHVLALRQAPLGEPEAADDRREDVVEIVRHAAGQLADRLELLRLEELLARVARALPAASLRSVRSRVILAKPTVSPVVVADRVDHDVGPEPAAVLAHAPALGLEAALPSSATASARAGMPGRAILVGVEAREMLADDLLGAIALEALRARRSSC